jgi:hypothetical protein
VNGLESGLAIFLKNVDLWLPIAASMLPLVVGFVTKRSTSSGLQGVLFSLAAGLLGVVQAAVAAGESHHAFAWGTALSAALVAWWTGQTAYIALWKHKIAGWFQDLPPIKDSRTATKRDSFASVLDEKHGGAAGPDSGTHRA